MSLISSNKLSKLHELICIYPYNAHGVNTINKKEYQKIK